jgi:hypothetical protein
MERGADEYYAVDVFYFAQQLRAGAAKFSQDLLD